MPSGIKRQPWHRQIGETSAAYDLFRCYLEQGGERSLVKVAEETNRRYGNVASCSAKHAWTKRAQAYDDYLAHLDDQHVGKTLQRTAIKRARRQLDHAEEGYTLGHALIEQAKQMLAVPLFERTVVETVNINGEEVEKVIILKPAGWNKATALKMAKVGDEIIRLSLEMETQRIGIVDINNLRPEVKLQYARAALEENIKQVDQLVDVQISTDPTLNRETVKAMILSNLPAWCAHDWKLTEDQFPLLTEGLDLLPAPQQDTLLLTENDLEN